MMFHICTRAWKVNDGFQILRRAWRTLAFAILLHVAAFPVTANAVVVPTDPGDYVPLPAGTSLGVLYYQRAYADRVYANGDAVPISFRLTTDIGIARYVRYLDVFGMTADAQFIVPLKLRPAARPHQHWREPMEGGGSRFVRTIPHRATCPGCYRRVRALWKER